MLPGYLGVGLVKATCQSVVVGIPTRVNGLVEDAGNKGANVRPCDVTPRGSEGCWFLKKDPAAEWTRQLRQGVGS